MATTRPPAFDTRADLLQSYHAICVARTAASKEFNDASREWALALVSRDTDRMDKTYKRYDKARSAATLRSKRIWDFSEKGTNHKAIMREYTAARNSGTLNELLNGVGIAAEKKPAWKNPVAKKLALKKPAVSKAIPEDKTRVTPWTIAKGRKQKKEQQKKKKKRRKAIASSTRRVSTSKVKRL